MKLISNPNMLIELLQQPWHWAFSGTMIALIVFLMTWMGRSFGVSSSFKAACTAMGARKLSSFFDIDLKQEGWRFMFVIGGLLGGVIAANFLSSPEAVDISNSTRAYLADAGMPYPESDRTGQGFMPTQLLNFTTIKGILLAIGGGFLVGFGARYADGCTSGHAITGLSHLQLPSLLTVIGFFIGGLLMTHFVLPFLL